MPTTIFSNALASDDSGDEGLTIRSVVAITGGAQDQVIVRWKAASAATFKTDNSSIGISTGTASNTTATPVQLKYGGVAGFTISNGATIDSDPVNLSGFTSANSLVAICDVNVTAGNGAPAAVLSGATGCQAYSKTGTSFNVAAPAGMSSLAVGSIFGVTLIQTQAVASGAALKKPAILLPGQGPSRGLRATQAFPPSAAAQVLTLSAAQGTYTVSGKAQTLNSTRSIAAAQGTYTVNGQAQTLNRGILISPVTGAYVINGVAQFFAIGMPAAQGAYSIAGQAVTPAVGMPAGAGAFTVTGQPQSFAVALSIKPATGAYTVTGNAVGLSLTPSGSSNAVHGNPFLASPGLMTSIP